MAALTTLRPAPGCFPFTIGLHKSSHTPRGGAASLCLPIDGRSTRVLTLGRRSPFRDVLANRAFAALWFGQTISNLGDVLYSFVLLWYVLDRTGSALLAGYVAVAATVGRLVGSLAAATVLDRTPVRRVLLLSDGARFLLTCVTGLWWFGRAAPPLIVIYVLEFCIALGGAFFNPARAAALPQIVAGEQLVAANALDKVAASLTGT